MLINSTRMRSMLASAISIGILFSLLIAAPQPSPADSANVADSIRNLQDILRRPDLPRDSVSTINKKLGDLARTKGRMDAIADLERRCPRICTMGLSPRIGLDDSTGFAYKTIAGCVVGPYEAGYSAGYNGFISKWIEENGVPEWSRKQWVEVFRSAKAFIETRTGSKEQMAIPSGDSSCVSPDESWSIAVGPPDTRYHRFPLIIAPSGLDPYETAVLWTADSDQQEIVWGPIGSDIAGLKWRNIRLFKGTPDTVYTYVLLDLRSGGQIHWEQESNWERNGRPSGR